MMIILLGGVAVLATSPVTCYARIIRAVHAGKAERLHRGRRTNQYQPGKIPKTPERGRGWVRTRDVNNPRIHTPPQPMPSEVQSTQG